MSYITSVERIGMRKGLEQGREEGRQEGRQEGRREGLLDGIALALDLKFGDASASLMDEIRQVTNLTVIQAIYDTIKTARTLDDLRSIYAPPASE